MMYQKTWRLDLHHSAAGFYYLSKKTIRNWSNETTYRHTTHIRTKTSGSFRRKMWAFNNFTDKESGKGVYITFCSLQNFWFSLCQTFVRRRSLWHDTRPGVYTNVVSHFSLDRKRYFCIFQKGFIFATVITEAKRKRRSLTWHCCNICHYSSKNVAQSALFKAHVDSRSCSRIHTATIWFVQTSLDTLVKTLSAKKKIHKMLTSGNLFSEGGQLSAQLASWQAQVLKMAYAHLVTEVLMCPAPVRV